MFAARNDSTSDLCEFVWPDFETNLIKGPNKGEELEENWFPENGWIPQGKVEEEVDDDGLVAVRPWSLQFNAKP